MKSLGKRYVRTVTTVLDSNGKAVESRWEVKRRTVYHRAGDDTYFINWIGAKAQVQLDTVDGAEFTHNHTIKRLRTIKPADVLAGLKP